MKKTQLLAVKVTEGIVAGGGPGKVKEEATATARVGLTLMLAGTWCIFLSFFLPASQQGRESRSSQARGNQKKQTERKEGRRGKEVKNINKSGKIDHLLQGDAKGRDLGRQCLNHERLCGGTTTAGHRHHQSVPGDHHPGGQKTTEIQNGTRKHTQLARDHAFPLQLDHVILAAEDGIHHDPVTALARVGAVDKETPPVEHHGQVLQCR